MSGQDDLWVLVTILTECMHYYLIASPATRLRASGDETSAAKAGLHWLWRNFGPVAFHNLQYCRHDEDMN